MKLSAHFPLTLRGRRITLTLLLLSILTSAISIQPVNASGTSTMTLIIIGLEIDGLSVSVDGIVFPMPLYTITGINWDWGDGNKEGSSFPASHTYSSYGDYTITVTDHQKSSLMGSYTSTVTIHISLKIMVETTDLAGERKDVFNIPETVYINGSGYTSSTSVDLHIVEDTAWSDGMDIPDRVSGTETSVETDVNGNIPEGTEAWKGPLTPGKYDIVIDVNNNGKYDEDIDALDDEDIKVTAGFFVIPELPLGTLMGVVSCFMAIAFFRFKRLNFKH